MNSRGFTLIEVVVAFTVLVLVLGALYRVFASASRQSLLAQQYTEAVALADSRLAEAGVTAPLVPGSFAGDAGRFRWERRVEPHLPGAWSVTVEVRWEHDGGTRSVSLTTVRLEAPA